MDENERDYNQSKGLLESIREINAKYRHPRIKMTRLVNISLWALRIYLIAMLLILFYKFATLVIH
ncbi:MAG TPA: hypothetical protein VF326_05890 [Anaerolineaceae bacterium]|jgi:hypothetical protein